VGASVDCRDVQGTSEEPEKSKGINGHETEVHVRPVVIHGGDGLTGTYTIPHRTHLVDLIRPRSQSIAHRPTRRTFVRARTARCSTPEPPAAGVVAQEYPCRKPVVAPRVSRHPSLIDPRIPLAEHLQGHLPLPTPPGSMQQVAGPSSSPSTAVAGPSGTPARLPTKHAHNIALRRGKSPLESQRYIFNERSTARFFGQGYNLDSPGSDGEVVDGALLAVPRTVTVTRPPSLSEFSIISPPGSPRESLDLDALLNTPTCGAPFANAFATQGRRNLAHTFSGSGYLTPTSASHGLGLHFGGAHSRRLRTPSPSKNTLSRIWDAFASPARSTSRGRKGKGKYRVPLDETFDYRDMDPLDGEEGELIDEACFIDIPAVTGIGKQCSAFMIGLWLMFMISGQIFCRAFRPNSLSVFYVTSIFLQ
jgi:hypothetical protein